MMKLNFFYGFQHVPQIIAFDLWPLELVENNTPVLHSLSSEGWQNFTWNSFILPYSRKHEHVLVSDMSRLVAPPFTT